LRFLRKVVSTIEKTVLSASETSNVRLTPAHEMHDLQFVALLERGLVPLCTRENVKVQLDRETVGFEAELFDQRGNGKSVRELARLTIDVEHHLERMYYAAGESTTVRQDIKGCGAD
jgi:hypothetical protein